VILLFFLAPVHAAPSLSLGSTAKYHVSIILHISNGCTADPIEYAGQACNPIIYYRPPGMIGGGGYLNVTTFTGNSTIFLQHPSPTITVFDHGACDSANDSCGFYPSYAITLLGNGVSWNNNGTLTHNITSMNTTSSGVPLFNATLPPNHTFIHTFTTPGTYPYYDSSHPSMHGTVSVIAYPNPPPVPIVTYPNPQPTNIQAEIDGTVSWTVVGLDNTNAVLKVDHELALSISPMPGITITPVHESGSFEQSIELNTRLESPGTASSIIAHVVGQFLNGLPSLGTSPVYGTPTVSKSRLRHAHREPNIHTRDRRIAEDVYHVVGKRSTTPRKSCQDTDRSCQRNRRRECYSRSIWTDAGMARHLEHHRNGKDRDSILWREPGNLITENVLGV